MGERAIGGVDWRGAGDRQRGGGLAVRGTDRGASEWRHNLLSCLALPRFPLPLPAKKSWIRSWVAIITNMRVSEKPTAGGEITKQPVGSASACVYLHEIS